MDITIHLGRPFQKAPEIVSLSPKECPKFQEADLLHLDACVGLDAPQQVGTAPGRDAMAAGGVPEEAKHGPHLRLV